jgi:hypothetical protein
MQRFGDTLRPCVRRRASGAAVAAPSSRTTARLAGAPFRDDVVEPADKRRAHHGHDSESMHHGIPQKTESRLT